MADIHYKTTFQFRRGNSDAWTKNNPVLYSGEPGYELDTGKLKIGDGTTAWNNLDYFGGTFTIDTTSGTGSFEVDSNGFIQLVGFNQAEVGQIPRKNEEGSLEWYTPTTSAESLGEAAIEEVNDIVSTYTYDKTEIDQKIVGLFYWGGTAGSLYEDGSILFDKDGNIIPAERGPVYDLDGVEYAWNGEKWEQLGVNIDVDQVVLPDNVVIGINQNVAYDANKATLTVNSVSKDENGSLTVQESSSIEFAAASVSAAGLLSAADKKKLDNAHNLFKEVEFEVISVPVGGQVDIREKEIRIMAAADTDWFSQNGPSSNPNYNANMYYVGVRIFAPTGKGITGFKEWMNDTYDDTLFDFTNAFAGTDAFGRNYSIIWLPIAVKSGEDSWTYYGSGASKNKMPGWTYNVQWFNADGVCVDSNQVRINLANESCFATAEPYVGKAYIASIKMGDKVYTPTPATGQVELPSFSSDEFSYDAETNSYSLGQVPLSKLVSDGDNEDIIVFYGGSGSEVIGN